MRKLQNLYASCLLIGMVGCGSTTNNYHTLVPSEPTHGGPAIQVARVTVPPQVDRAQLVVRRGSTGLAILETEWWGANLLDEFKSALQDQLGGPPAVTSAVLAVDVQRFDSVPGQYAALDATWRLKRSGGGELACRTSVQTPADASVASLVNAHQANLHKLALDVRAAAEAGGNRCPD